MTDERGRKLAIRQRMAETGEKYTEARRAVLGTHSQTVSGDRWLAEVFDPALRADEIRYSNVVDRWRGAVTALEACGLLSAEEAADAQLRLKDANQAAMRRAAPVLAQPGSAAPPPSDTLRRAFTPMAPLVDFEGVTLVVVSVEFWSRSVRLRIAGLHNATSDEFDEGRRRALERWAERARDADSHDRWRDDLPGEGARLLDMRLKLSDELGTHYRPSNRGTSWSPSEWRYDATFEPGIPSDAGDLTIQVSDIDGKLVNEVTLAVPPQR